MPWAKDHSPKLLEGAFRELRRLDAVLESRSECSRAGRSPRRCRDCQFRNDAEMVAGPDTAYRAVEDAPAGGNVERGPVIATAHEDVVDTASGLERHLTVHHQRVTERPDQWVSRCKRVAKLARVRGRWILQSSQSPARILISRAGRILAPLRMGLPEQG